MIFHDVSVFRLQESMKIEKKGNKQMFVFEKIKSHENGGKVAKFPQSLLHLER